MLVDVEPCGECSGLQLASPFVYEDLRSLCLACCLHRCSGCRGTWEFTFCAMCIRVASIRSTAALTVSTFFQHTSVVTHALLLCRQWSVGCFESAPRLAHELEPKFQISVDASLPYFSESMVHNLQITVLTIRD